ncbi:MAG: L-seryl-tRNA(Sec) selenium transferase [Candidatus Hydrogenedentes bacterium]|nr:L-seryl-tRNA(Sec) selenium transferase [Candidatus Hydrogenedentota bacterium]
MSPHEHQGSGDDPRKNLPSVAELLDSPAVRKLLALHPRPLVLDAVRRALDWHRARIAAGHDVPASASIAEHVASFFQDGERDRLRKVINATGIILHTGLGRAVLPRSAVDALGQLDGCCNLQIDLETGLRGKRNAATESLLCRLTGAEAAMVVNNNAAATLLILAALCANKEVIVSRGQLIEIGGSYRLPDCVHQSGAVLVEVGTTNKTHLRDYESAISENTGAILRVNPSNYRIVGFSESVAIEQLVELGKGRPVVVIDDLGCGALVNLEQYGLPHEPTVQESVAAGADLACFSGDKLIGGPQAGIIVGRKELIARIRKHPLTRMLRVGKLTDMALQHTLRLYLEPEKLLEMNPTLRMMTLPVSKVKRRAQQIKRLLDRQGLALECAVEPVDSATGGGSLPDVALPSFAVAVAVHGLGAEELARRLRRGEPPVVARIQEGRVRLDSRTLLDGEEQLVVQALSAIAGNANREVESGG